ncbi:MAG TPA: hypothetical protein DHW02_04540, partial [Ktedonobacter sp.]|nr:hypothetical protein [Ktedonobacter sp.]
TFSVINGLAASPASASPGTGVTINGTGFQAAESVALYWDNTSGQLLTTTSADTNGNISQVVTFPANATSGSHNMIGVGLTSQKTYTEPVTVNTNWGAFGSDDLHDRNNAYESSLGTTNV